MIKIKKVNTGYDIHYVVGNKISNLSHEGYISRMRTGDKFLPYTLSLYPGIGLSAEQLSYIAEFMAKKDKE